MIRDQQSNVPAASVCLDACITLAWGQQACLLAFRVEISRGCLFCNTVISPTILCEAMCICWVTFILAGLGFEVS